MIFVVSVALATSHPAGAAATPAQPPGPDAADAKAVEVYARGDYAGAVKLLASLHGAGKANIQQRLILARAYLHLGKDADSLAVLRSVLQTDKENPEANSLTGQLLLKAGKHAEALACLEHAWRLKSDPVTAAALGRCHYALGQLAKAKAFLQQALQQDIRDPSTSMLLGRICLDRGQGALAQKYLLMAHEAGEDSLDLHRMLGRAYLLQHVFVGPVLVRGYTKPPQPGQAVGECVVIRAVPGAAGRYEVCTRYSALYEGLWVLARSPKDADGLYMTARGWLAAGRADLAGKSLAGLLAAEPKGPRAAELQAELALASRDFAALDKCLRAAQSDKALAPARIADFHYRWGMWLRSQGKLAEAIGPLQQAEVHAPASAKVLRALASLYAAAGRKGDARAYYTRIVELFPDAADIDELRNELKLLSTPQTTGERP